MLKKILLTGQSGLNKSEYLEKARPLFEKENMSFSFDTIGKKMIGNYNIMINDANREINERSILNLPKPLLDLLHRISWDELIAKVKEKEQGKKEQEDLEEESEKEIYAINTHCVFRWHHGLVPAIDRNIVGKFGPDIVITLIDDIIKIKKALEERGTYFYEFWELYSWRENEILISKFIADSLGIKSFILPKSQGAELFVDLFCGPSSEKVYLSFPITGMSSQENKEIEAFKNKVKEHFTAFDPFSITDRNLIKVYYDNEKEIVEKANSSIASLKEEKSNRKWCLYRDEWTPLDLVKFNISGTELLGRDLRSVMETTDSQIISRDYLLIDQSDLVIIYIKEDEEGDPRVSAGCQSEMLYAYLNGKKVYVVFRGGCRRLSPWITQYSEVFESLDDCLSIMISRKED
ncbi:MAG: hypothetical protein HXS52_13475 [Theionarchaea archaeon]|nr:hypothetical protein [Theionarchaea archaeon]